MKVMRWIGALMLVPAVAGAQVEPRPITLQETLDLARKNAPAVVRAHGDERSSTAAVRAAYGAFIPSLNLTAGATRGYPGGARTTTDPNGQVIVLREPWSYQTSLGASVQLFAGGQRFFDLREAKARDAAAEVGILSEEYTATLNAKQQFFNVLAAREAQVAAAAQLEQAEQQRRTSVALARARQTTRSDSLRAEIQLRNAQLAVADARNTLEVSNASLTRAIGVDELVTASPAAEDTLSEGLALADPELMTMAERGPLVRQSESLLRAARAANTARWTDYLPSANLSWTGSGSATDADFTIPDTLRQSGALRLTLSLPIFDQFQREERHVNTDVAEDNAQASLRDARLAAREGVVRWLGTYRVADERVRAQIATVEAAEEDLRVQQQRYAVGGSTLLDVLASQTQLNQARRDLIQARLDQRVAKAQLEALVGRDL
jgi:outer membrane protein